MTAEAQNLQFELSEANEKLEAMQAEIDRRDEALSWAEGHDPWLVEKIRERASLDRQGK